MKHFETIAEFESELKSFLGEDIYTRARAYVIRGWMPTTFPTINKGEQLYTDPDIRKQCWETYLERRMGAYQCHFTESYFFEYGFVWDETIEGLDFWWDINKKWKIYIEN